jgi:SAM-dependent methyltransferase
VSADAESTSFGNVAETYDRVRPGPAPAALDWLVPAGCAVAVDLAAGTGLFTRALLGRVGRLVAVEPDPRMREVLARRTPGLDVRAGQGEAIPLPDASADVVFVSTAWHWLDLSRAVPEIARVLRPGGRLGVLWTSRDRAADWAADWAAELDLVPLNGIPGGVPSGGAAPADPSAPPAEPSAPPAEPGGGEPGTGGGPGGADAMRAQLDRHHAVILPPGSAFGAGETATFGFERTMPAADVIEWLATNSACITASPAEQRTARARWRQILLGQAGGSSPDGAGPVVRIPLRSWCWRARRA